MYLSGSLTLLPVLVFTETWVEVVSTTFSGKFAVLLVVFVSVDLDVVGHSVMFCEESEGSD